MPEGDAAYRAARRLDRHLGGQVLVSADLRVPAHATVDLRGATVLRTDTRGKHMLTRLWIPNPAGDTGTSAVEWTLHTHLGMDGRWRFGAPGARWQGPSHQARVVLSSQTTEAVGFSLKLVEFGSSAEIDATLNHLGPDLLGADWDLDQALARLRDDPERTIHQALLDQRNLAGLGNMYVAEACFLAGVHPTTPVGRVPDLSGLVDRSQRLLRANRDRTRTTATGDQRTGRQWWVYRRDRAACRRCGTPVAVDRSGPPGRDRAIYWCPHCQPQRPD